MKTLKRSSLCSLAATSAAAVMAFGLAAPAAHAQVGFGITIGEPPPPLRYEARGYAPGPGYVWQEGYWVPDPDGDGHYRWQRGAWVRAPYPDAYYIHPHYYRYDDVYHYQPGYWSRERHDERHYYKGHDDDDRRDNDRHDNGRHEGEHHHDDDGH